MNLCQTLTHRGAEENSSVVRSGLLIANRRVRVTAASARKRTLLAREAVQFGSEMAAPVDIKDANWHRSKQLHKECGWKRGDSAIANLE